MICLSADQFAENLLESNGADVKRSKLEGRSGIFDVEMDSGVSLDHLRLHFQMKGVPTATAPMEIPTVPPPAPPVKGMYPAPHIHEHLATAY